jgi:phosphoribosylamine--glycine ligase
VNGQRSRMRILIIGKDARTDALASACAASRARPELFAYTEFEIPGLLDKCTVYLGSLVDIQRALEVAREVHPDLVIIGPEEPLVAGFVDALESLGFPCFGPSKALAQVEGSKAWTRRLLEEHQIEGNPRHRVFRTTQGLRSYLAHMGDFVVKPDGLTGGKGVRVFGEHLNTINDAYDYANALIENDGLVLIEERLDGEEFSLQTITDGTTAIHCPLVQDHKRAHDGDTGPNTGGMGSYSCANFGLPFLTLDDIDAARRTNEAVIAALKAETGRPYRGVLYGGFMATAQGLRVVEYNARFGDPEALNVLSLLRTDFVDICEAVVEGRLGGVDVIFDRKATVCKYVVPEGYPENKGMGDPISIAGTSDDDSIRCYWAATNRRDSQILLSGSRAVAFVGVGSTLDEAERYAEHGATSVVGPVRHRSDIGTSEVVEARVQHMRSLRGIAATALALSPSLN